VAHLVGPRHSRGAQHLRRHGRALVERAFPRADRNGRLPGDELHFHDRFRNPAGHLDLGGRAMERRPNPRSHRRPWVQLAAGLARLRHRASVLGHLGNHRAARLRTAVPAFLALERVSRSGWTSEIFLWLLVSLSAGFCEELVFRGYLQRQFHAATGNVVVAVALQAIVFGLVHTYQGWKPVLVITVLGATARSLPFAVICAPA
jgi:hypothetical protein